MTKLSTLETGFFHSDGGAMFGLLPKSIWLRHYPADNNNLCRMAMRCLIYKKKDKIVIFDTGAGIKPDKRMIPYGFFQQKDLKHLLWEHGVHPNDVTDIVLSHLHFDHCGGLTETDEVGNITPVFPNATYYISKSQWQHHLHPGLLDADAYFYENTLFLQQSPHLRLIDSTTFITPEIEVSLFDGHTPGQLVSFIRTDEDCFVFAGDVIPLALNLHIDSISAFDLMAEISAEERVRLLERVAAENATLIFYHDAYTTGIKIKKVGRHFRAIPAPALPNIQDEQSPDEHFSQESNSDNVVMP
ncbi:MAG: MBL fold metallo-hydrolase [Bacteroidales bacterium]